MISLGCLVEVIEDHVKLNYVKTYTYDLLNNLVKTMQDGQIRTFV